MEIDQKEIKHIVETAITEALNKSEYRSDQRMKQYIGTLKEDSDHKIQAIFEYVQDIPQMKEDLRETKERVQVIEEKQDRLEAKQDILEEKQDKMETKQDIMFEALGAIAEDVTIIKETAKDHEVRLQQVETR